MWSTLVDYRHREVLKYYTPLNFYWDCNNVVINKELWDGLPADLQEAIMRAGRIAEERDYEAHRRNELEYIKMFMADPNLEVYFPTPEERALFSEKGRTPEIWEELATPYLDERYPGQNMTQQMLDELAEIKKQCAGG